LVWDDVGACKVMMFKEFQGKFFVMVLLVYVLIIHIEIE